MRWLTLPLVKSQLRVTETYEDSLITLYAESAEETILEWCGRTYEELLEMNNNTFPKKLIQASLMLVDLSYENRSPVSMSNLHIIPYGNIDVLVKPYMKL